MKEKKKRFKHEHGSSFSVDYYAYASHMRSWMQALKFCFLLLVCLYVLHAIICLFRWQLFSLWDF